MSYGSINQSDLISVAQMLSSIQGMVERTRQSMAVLKDRVSNTHTEMERKEVWRGCGCVVGGGVWS